ncbi:MAG: phage tail protein [Lewinellaceae bacterium]|nr:phage tail protein [Saprospiraceae bacterium]MCB9337493.1 phage tail protein [Lewinellaceae bacterium]
MEGMISEIRLWAANFEPRGWMFCKGQILSIAQNTALFSLLGTTYGGDGHTTFALPDLRSRVPVGEGQGPGLSQVHLGETKGSELTTLLLNNLPMHSHQVKVSNKFAGGDHPAGRYLGASAADKGFYDTTSDNSTMAPDMIAPAGGSQPFNNLQPSLGLNFIICVQGYFPSRA